MIILERCTPHKFLASKAELDEDPGVDRDIADLAMTGEKYLITNLKHFDIFRTILFYESHK